MNTDPKPISRQLADGTPERLGRYRLVRPISTGGMARVFGYLMGDGDVHLEDSAIFNDTSDCIRAAMERCHARSPERTGLSSTGLSIALEQLL